MEWGLAGRGCEVGACCARFRRGRPWASFLGPLFASFVLDSQVRAARLGVQELRVAVGARRGAAGPEFAMAPCVLAAARSCFVELGSVATCRLCNMGTVRTAAMIAQVGARERGGARSEYWRGGDVSVELKAAAVLGAFVRTAFSWSAWVSLVIDHGGARSLGRGRATEGGRGWSLLASGDTVLSEGDVCVWRRVRAVGAGCFAMGWPSCMLRPRAARAAIAQLVVTEGIWAKLDDWQSDGACAEWEVAASCAHFGGAALECCARGLSTEPVVRSRIRAPLGKGARQLKAADVTHRAYLWIWCRCHDLCRCVVH